MPNRRHHVRHRRRFKVTLGRTSCFSTDVSAGGFCAELVRGLVPGAGVEGSIQIDGRELPFAGLVAWVRAGDVGLSLRARIGVHFTRIPEEFPRLLELHEEAKRGRPVREGQRPVEDQTPIAAVRARPSEPSKVEAPRLALDATRKMPSAA